MTVMPQSIIYGLLADQRSNRILLLPNGEEWSLPSVRIDREVEITAVTVSHAMSQGLDFPVIAVRYARIDLNPETHPHEGYFVLDAMGSSEALALRGRWAGMDDIAGWTGSVQREVILELLQEAQTGPPQHRQPWESPGWYAQVESWITESLDLLGIQPLESPQLVKWWSLSSVLKLATSQGELYFKASAAQPLFVNEPVFLDYWSQVTPVYVPAVLASDSKTGWMLSRGFGGQPARQTGFEQKLEVVRTFGALQLESIGHTEALLQLGCKDRRPHSWPLPIDSLLEDEVVHSQLTEEERLELSRNVPRIQEMGRKLLEYIVPYTLVHGDLHLGNVAVGEGTLIYFDWTDASISHPFFDMFPIYHEKNPELRLQLRDAYLSLWTGFEPMKRLLELWSLCEVLHAIYHTVSYQSILQHTEIRSRRELGDGPAFHLRNALRKLRSLDEETRV